MKRTPQLFKTSHLDPDDLPMGVVAKHVRLPTPVFTRMLRLVVEDGGSTVDVKVDVFGETADVVYAKDPALDAAVISEGEHYTVDRSIYLF